MRYAAPRFLFRRHEILRRLRRSGSFLEVGAGNLALSRELLKHFDTGLAIDFTDDLEQSFAALPASDRERLECRNIDFLAEPAGREFDCVIACEVMEHIEDDAAFLKRVAETLAPGGQAIISVPARAKYWSIHDELVGHVRRYEKAELVDKAGAAGFEKIDVVSYGYPWVNLLRFPRIWLARKNLSDRRDWDQQRQTSMSNHRQIPAWLTTSLVPVLFNAATIYPFALLSRLFNRMDLSNGYILTVRKKPAR